MGKHGININYIRSKMKFILRCKNNNMSSTKIRPPMLFDDTNNDNVTKNEKKSDEENDMLSDSTMSLNNDNNAVNEEVFDDFKKLMNVQNIKNKEDIDFNNNNNNNDTDDDSYSADNENNSAGSISEVSMSSAVATEVSDEGMKLDYISKLRIMKDNGHVVKEFGLNDKTIDIKLEYHRVKCALETKASIKFQQKMLMAFVTMIEFVNKRFDPFDVNLEGWSENILENIDDYENIFEKLHEKYKSKREIAPELELLMALAGSAFMFNLTNTMYKKINPENIDIRGLQDSIRTASNNNQQQRAPQPMGGLLNGLNLGQLPDLSSLFGGLMSPPPPMSNNEPVSQQQVQNQQQQVQNQQVPPVQPQVSDNDDSDVNERFSIASSDSETDNVTSSKTPVVMRKQNEKKPVINKNKNNKREIVL